MSRSVTDFKYIGPLYLRRDLDGKGCVFIVDRPYPFSYLHDGVWVESEVPAEFPTDLASIPKVFRSFISRVEHHAEAAVVHDFLYQNKIVSRKVADEVFVAAMAAKSVPLWKREVMYLSVRGGAWWAYGREVHLR